MPAAVASQMTPKAPPSPTPKDEDVVEAIVDAVGDLLAAHEGAKDNRERYENVSNAILSLRRSLLYAMVRPSIDRQVLRALAELLDALDRDPGLTCWRGGHDLDEWAKRTEWRSLVDELIQEIRYARMRLRRIRRCTAILFRWCRVRRPLPGAKLHVFVFPES